MVIEKEESIRERTMKKIMKREIMIKIIKRETMKKGIMKKEIMKKKTLDNRIQPINLISPEIITEITKTIIEEATTKTQTDPRLQIKILIENQRISHNLLNRSLICQKISKLLCLKDSKLLQELLLTLKK